VFLRKSRSRRISFSWNFWNCIQQISTFFLIIRRGCVILGISIIILLYYGLSLFFSNNLVLLLWCLLINRFSYYFFIRWQLIVIFFHNILTFLWNLFCLFILDVQTINLLARWVLFIAWFLPLFFKEDIEQTILSKHFSNGERVFVRSLMRIIFRRHLDDVRKEINHVLLFAQTKWSKNLLFYQFAVLHFHLAHKRVILEKKRYWRSLFD